MDEIFGDVGLARADEELKQRIERDIGLLALLDGEDSSAGGVKQDITNDSGDNHTEPVEKTSS